MVVFLQEADAERKLCAMGAVGAALELQEADEINLVESQINLSPVHSHRARDNSNNP